ncbi:hypothetical protein CSW69_26660, partial [Shigella sonnei]
SETRTTKKATLKNRRDILQPAIIGNTAKDDWHRKSSETRTTKKATLKNRRDILQPAIIGNTAKDDWHR